MVFGAWGTVLLTCTGEEQAAAAVPLGHSGGRSYVTSPVDVLCQYHKFFELSHSLKLSGSSPVGLGGGVTGFPFPFACLAGGVALDLAWPACDWSTALATTVSGGIVVAAAGRAAALT